MMFGPVRQLALTEAITVGGSSVGSVVDVDVGDG